jgi:aconitase B
MAADVYRYLNFDQIDEYREVADKVPAGAAA